MKSVADVLEERGMKKGLQQGLEQGLEQGQINLLVRQLNRRFGLGPDEEQMVRSCRDMTGIETAAI